MEEKLISLLREANLVIRREVVLSGGQIAKFYVDVKRAYRDPKLLDLLGESIAKMVLSGGGIARLSAFMVRENITQGKLSPLLENHNFDEWQPIYLLHPGHISARVKCIIDFIFNKLGGKHFT